MSEATAINELCQQPDWSGVGISMHPAITSFAALEAQLDEWAQFTLDDLDGLYDAINILPAAVHQNGVLTCAYEANGKQSVCYGWSRHYGMTQDGPVNNASYNQTGKASLLIPGSGMNPAKAIMARSSGYQDALFNPCCTIGDGFIHVLPGMDFRFLKGGNGNGMLTDAINYALLARGSSLAVLHIVEATALLKWLRTNYAKTAVLGISKSAWIAAVVGILGNPTACVSAGGFTFTSPAQSLSQTGANIHPGIDGVFSESELISRIQASSTKFRFSKSTVSELAVLIYEATNGDYTSSQLNFTNCTHVIHDEGHRYDSAMGSWLASALV